MITDYYIIASLIYLCCMGLVYLIWRRRNIDRREYCLLFFVGLVMIWLSPALMERLGPTTLIMIYTLVPLTAAAVSTRIGKKEAEAQGTDHAPIGDLAMVAAGEVSISETAPKTRGGKFLDKIRRIKTADDEPAPTAAEVPADEGLVAVTPVEESREGLVPVSDAVAAEATDEVRPTVEDEPLPSWFRDERIPPQDEAWADNGLEADLPVDDGLMNVALLPEEAEHTEVANEVRPTGADGPLPSWFRDKVEEQPAEEILPADVPVLEAEVPDEIPAAIATTMDDTAAPAVEEDIAELEQAPAEDAEFIEAVKLEAEDISLEDHIPSDEPLVDIGDSAIDEEAVGEVELPAAQIPVTVAEEIVDVGQAAEEIEAVVPAAEIFVEPEAGNLPVVSEQKQVKSARERMLEEKVNRLLEAGFQAKFASDWTEAIRRFEEVLQITKDASLRGMLVQDIAHMYLEVADYNRAEQAYQDYLKDDLTVDERNRAAREALKIRYMEQELTTCDMPLMPYRKVPRLLQIKVEEMLNRIDISKQMEGSKKRK